LLSPRASGLSLSLGPGKHIAVQAPLVRSLNFGVGAPCRCSQPVTAKGRYKQKPVLIKTVTTRMLCRAFRKQALRSRTLLRSVTWRGVSTTSLGSSHRRSPRGLFRASNE
jgi:hypothetical protein